MVYQGRRKKSIEYFAIKSVDKSQKAKVLNEVSILHTLDHANVLKFHSWYETSNHIWVILEFCVGGDLHALLMLDSVLPETVVQRFAGDIVRGLQYIHSQGVVYCDLKPTNLLLEADARVKLCDFGLSQRLASIRMAVGDQLAPKRGSPYYMAPELFKPRGLHSFASDFWALGCVLYEMAVGRPPFVSASLSGLMDLILNSKVNMPSHLSAHFVDLLEGLLEKNPVRRMTWDELRRHPFWTGSSGIDKLKLPVETEFELYCRQVVGESPRKARPVSVASPQPQSRPSSTASVRSTGSASASPSRASPPSSRPTTSSSSSAGRAAASNGDVDVLRLSQILARRNRNANGGTYTTAASAAKSPSEVDGSRDVRLGSYDQELNFAADDDARSPAANLDESDRFHTAEEFPVVADDGARAEDVVEATMADDVVRSSRKTPTGGRKAAATSSPAADRKRRTSPAADAFRPRTTASGTAAAPVAKTTTRPSTAASSIRARTRPASSSARSPARGDELTASVEGKSLAHLMQEVPPGLAVSELLYTDSDAVIRPIIMGRSKAPDRRQAKYDAATLPFPAVGLDQMLAMSQTELETLLTLVYRSIASQSPVADKLNVLLYFETLCDDTQAANILVNSSLMTLFVKMLKAYKSPSLKCRLVMAMGLLVRYATFISDELADSGLVPVLADLLVDSNANVRRCVMACLGELLFYIATQETQEAQLSGASDAPAATPQRAPTPTGASSVPVLWQVTSETYARIIECLRTDEDAMVHYYAAKTMENIASHTAEHAAHFARPDVPSLLVSVFTRTDEESVRVTALSALARILRQCGHILPDVVRAVDPGTLIEAIGDRNSKVAQAAINIVNSILHAGGSHADALIGGDIEAIVSALMSVLCSHASPVLFGKALVALALVATADETALVTAFDLKLTTCMERVAKEKEEYARRCLQSLVLVIVAAVPSAARALSAAQGDAAAPLSLLLHTMTSNSLRPLVVSDDFVTRLAGWLRPSGPAKAQWMQTLLLVCEAFSQDAVLSLRHHMAVLEALLPAMCELLESESGDTRFLALQMVSEVLMLYLNDAAVYSLSEAGSSGVATGDDDAAASSAASTKLVNQVVVKHLLPRFRALLEDEKPIPVYCLKLLNSIVERNAAFISVVYRLQLIPLFFDFFALEHENNNIQNIRLVRRITESADVERKYIYSLGLTEKLNDSLEYAYTQAIDSFLEPLLDIIYSLLYFTLDSVKAAASPLSSASGAELLEANGPLLENFDIYLALLRHETLSTCENSCRCLYLFVQLYPDESMDALGRVENLSTLAKALTERSTSETLLLKKRILKTLQGLCAVHPGAMGDFGRTSASFLSALRWLSESPEASLAALAHKLLEA